MQDNETLDTLFSFLLGPVIGRATSDLVAPMEGERVVIVRQEDSSKPLSLPELTTSELDDSMVADPLPIIDIFDWTTIDEFQRRTSAGWDVLVAVPPPGALESRDELYRFLSASMGSARDGSRAIFILPAMMVRNQYAVRHVLIEQGGLRGLVFPASSPPRSMGMAPSLRLVLAAWSPDYSRQSPTRIVSIDRAGEVEREFDVVLNPDVPWSVRALDPAHQEHLDRWAANLDAVPLPEVAEVVRPVRVPTDGGIVLHPRQITPTGIDLAVEVPSSEGRREPASHFTQLQTGDVICRALGDPNWCIVTSDQLVSSVFVDRQVLVLRSTGIDPVLLLAFLRSDAATRQFATFDDGTVPRVTTRALDALRVPTGIQPRLMGPVDAVREFKATSQRLANEFEARYRAAFDEPDRDSIAEALADAATEASLALDLVERATDPLHRARQFLPHPLARTLRSYENDRQAGTPQEVYAHLLRFGETTITILGILGLSYLTAVQRQPLVPEWSSGFSRGVSLGTWLRCANEGAKAARQAGEPLAGLAAALSTRSPLNSVLDEFLSARQDQSHGAGPRSAYEYERRVVELEDKLNICLDQLVPLARSDWFIVSSLQWLESDQTFRVFGRSLTGDHPDFARWESRRAKPLESDVVFARFGSLDIPLLGFCQLRSCPKCLNEELYYPDRLNGSMVRLRSLDRGHQTELPLASCKLPSELGMRV